MQIFEHRHQLISLLNMLIQLLRSIFLLTIFLLADGDVLFQVSFELVNVITQIGCVAVLHLGTDRLKLCRKARATTLSDLASPVMTFRATIPIIQEPDNRSDRPPD